MNRLGVKNAFRQVKTEFQNTGYRLAMGDVNVLTKGDKLTVAIVGMFMVLVMFAMSFARFHAEGGTGIIESFDSEFGTLYTKLFNILWKAAAVGLLACVIWLVFSPSSKSAEKPIAWMKRIIIAFFCAMIIGGVFAFIDGATTKVQFNPNTVKNAG